ncbi:Zinc finger protein 79 [Grifola frondosa]|uniref:Zinc finger protein 79 n=1 Tax=Grifola frondosa TaxID=5627 RepID=A0A1C7MCB8_GRIFR|nr:Zinc finger protein 79 [Grifola frondosa]
MVFARKLPRLSSLVISGSLNDDYHLHPKFFQLFSQFKSITHFYIHELHFSCFGDVVRIIWALPNLSSLVCDNVNWPESTFNLSSSILKQTRNCPPLVTVRICSYSGLIIGQLLYSLVGTCVEHLELEIATPFEREVIVPSESARHIRDLTHLRSITFTAPWLDYPTIHALLSQTSHIREVTLRNRNLFQILRSVALDALRNPNLDELFSGAQFSRLERLTISYSDTLQNTQWWYSEVAARLPRAHSRGILCVEIDVSNAGLWTEIYPVRSSELQSYCDRCNRDFSDAHALWQHENTSRMHNICPTCKRDFASEDALIQHSVNKLDHYYCERCARYFSDDVALSQHKANSSKHYVCDICEKDFSAEASLVQHMDDSHHFCQTCDRDFSSEESLHQHTPHTQQSSLHMSHGPDGVWCLAENCGRRFDSHAPFLQHLESGACPSGMNGNRLARIMVLANGRHGITNPDMFATERARHGRQYNCGLCDRAYATVAALQAHLLSPAHAGERYRCPIAKHGCGVEFSMLSGFWRHMESGRCEVYRIHGDIQDAIQDVLMDQ